MPHKVKAALFASAFFTLLFSCSQKDSQWELASRRAAAAAVEDAEAFLQKKARALDLYIASLDDAARLSQLFVVNLEGSKEYSFVEWVGKGDGRRPLVPGGYIFFSFNISSEPREIATFTDSVKDFALLHECPPPFLCLDAEGGYVNRLRFVAGSLPENEWVSENLSLDEAFRLYSLNARQIRALGFDLNLSPVVDVQTEGNKDFLDGRSFGSPDSVIQYGSAAVRAYQENGVAATLKHFPGNGSVDPHLALPRLSYSLGEFYSDVFRPFDSILMARPAAVLMSHALVEVSGGAEYAGGENSWKAPDAAFQSNNYLQAQNSGGLFIDQEKLLGLDFSEAKETPASLSAFWIRKVLRGRLGFLGLVFSDDIFMAALEKNGWKSERAVREAVLSGANCILMSEKRFLNEWTLAKRLYDSDPDFRAAADDSIRRVFKFKLDFGLLEYDATRQTVFPARNKKSVEERMTDFYEAKRWNQEALSAS